MPFSVVRDVFNLSHKYQAGRLSGDIIKRLRQCYPSDWNLQRHPSYKPSILHSPIQFDNWPLDSMDVVCMSKRFDIKDTLASAVYAASQASLSDLFRGFNEGRWDLTDLQFCLEAREMLAFGREEVFQWVAKSMATSCECIRNIPAWTQLHSGHIPVFLMHDTWFSDLKLCAICRDTGVQILVERQNIVWQRLTVFCCRR